MDEFADFQDGNYLLLVERDANVQTLYVNVDGDWVPWLRATAHLYGADKLVEILRRNAFLAKAELQFGDNFKIWQSLYSM